ncbi:NAPDH-dependent diflavin reductase [Xylographa trunciseda]|nr:NAPDH-dependent diflavin reductase [Xylographa trunciseda]
MIDSSKEKVVVAKHRRALVLYGSETGNAQDIADEIGRMTERLHFSTNVGPLNAVEPSILLDFTVIIISISTTGQGDLPNNARRFWSILLRKKLPPTYLLKANFTVFGLGDSSYPKYNFAAHKLQRRLIQLGAEEFFPRGEGDEQHPEGYESTFIPWLNSLREHLLTQYPPNNGIEPIPSDRLLPPKVTLVLEKQDQRANGHSGNIPQSFSNDDMMTKKATVLSAHPNGIPRHGKQYLNSAVELEATLEHNQRITPDDHWQDVRHLSFSANGSYIYAPGDILTIYPKNAPEDVDQIIDLMGWNEIAISRITILSHETISTDPSVSLSVDGHDSGLTLRRLLTNNIDLNAIPRRSFFSLIANFTEDNFQKERLLEFTNPIFVDELYDYTTRPRRSILEVLQEFDTVKIPWQWAAAAFPKLRGRQFSIASGGELKYGDNGSTRFELLVAIVKYRTVIKKVRQGTCTRYLAGLLPGTSLRVSLQKGDLSILQSDTSKPVLMIGPGTGVAPMRSLIWERLRWAQLLQQSANDTAANDTAAKDSRLSVGKTVLLYGCRNHEADFFFSGEWDDLKTRMPLQVFTACSRDQKEKRYVQDLVKEQGKLVYELLHETDGFVYVCGSSGKMPLAVRESLVDVFQQRGAMERDHAEIYLARMEKEGRYKQETW